MMVVVLVIKMVIKMILSQVRGARWIFLMMVLLSAPEDEDNDGDSAECS